MDDKHYVPGSFYRIDDRTGFKRRAYRTRKEWTGLIVDRQVWEARQPQDFVKGVFDDQTVPQPRPRSPNTFIEIGTGGAQFMVWGDNPLFKGFLVQDNAGVDLDTNTGTAQMNVWNGTIAPVAASALPGDIT